LKRAAEAASDVVIRRPTPARAGAPPAPHLAEALFQQAGATQGPLERPWIVTDASASKVNDLDEPAFLRRRRSLRDFQGVK